MTGRVHYVPEHRDLDLGKLSGADYRVITSLHNEIKRDDRVLLCLEHGGDGAMHVVRRQATSSAPEKYFARHFAGEGHDRHDDDHEISRKSAEHQNEQDYCARPPQDAGMTVGQEVVVDGGVLDVAITGCVVPTDIEIQRYEQHSRKINNRTKTYYAAGYLPAWFNDWGPRPRMLDSVPALGCNNPRIFSEGVPPRRAVTATGLRVVEARKCATFDNLLPRCPDGSRRPCGREHPVLTPALGLSVDDVVVGVPAGEIVPLRSWDGHAYLVHSSCFERYQHLTDGQGTWMPGSAFQTKRTQRYKSGRCRYHGHIPCLCDMRPGEPDPVALAELDRWRTANPHDHKTGRGNRSPGPGQLCWICDLNLVENMRQENAEPVLQVTGCIVPDCTQPPRLYAGGKWCDSHKPSPGGFITYGAA